MKYLLAFSISAIFFSVPAIAATSPVNVEVISPGDKITYELIRKKIAGMKVKQVQKIAGRKLTLKEKLAFLLLKKKLRHEEKASRGGQTALALGISGLAFLVIGLFAPYIILASIVASICAIVVGSSALKKDPSDRKAHSGKLLGWISLSLAVLLITLAAIIVSSAWN